MTPTATYIAEENCLQELPRMEKEICLLGIYPCTIAGRKKCECQEYNAHLATLRKIPCSPEPGFKDGQKYTEGVDYEIKGAGDWKWCYQLKGNIFAAPIVPVKSEPDMPNLILTAFQNEPVNFLLSNALRHLTQDQQRQLCNALQERLPVPASIEDEAKRLYPYSGSLLQNDTLENRFAEVKRRVHITCARQYMDTIEKLRAENNKMRKALEEDGWIKIKDFALANMPDYDELVLWRDESGKYFCEMLDKDGNPWLEEPYKVTHYKKIIPPEQ